MQPLRHKNYGSVYQFLPKTCANASHLLLSLKKFCFVSLYLQYTLYGYTILQYSNILGKYQFIMHQFQLLITIAIYYNKNAVNASSAPPYLKLHDSQLDKFVNSAVRHPLIGMTLSVSNVSFYSHIYIFLLRIS